MYDFKCILLCSDADHFESLLRRIYRPFNSYCIHIDSRSNLEFVQVIRLLAECYHDMFNVSNIHVVSEMAVIWGLDSILRADLLCFKILFEKFPSWTALVNIAGSEYPIRSNLAFVKKFLNSKKNNEKGAVFERKLMTTGMYQRRLKFYWQKGRLRRTKTKRPPPPFRLTLYKGQRSGILDRYWVWFLLHHPVSKTFLDWSLDSGHTEEHFLQTLTMIDKIDWSPESGYIVRQRRSWTSEPIVRATWAWSNVTCHGKWRHSVCVYGLSDIPHILNVSTEGPVMANKFLTDVDPNVVPCLDKIVSWST